MSLFPSIFFIFVPFPLSLCMESTSYVLSFRIVFFYLVTTGWIFYISLCEISIKNKAALYKIVPRSPSFSFCTQNIADLQGIK